MRKSGRIGVVLALLLPGTVVAVTKFVTTQAETAAPVAVGGWDANGEGTSLSFARADHRHLTIPQAAPTWVPYAGDASFAELSNFAWGSQRLCKAGEVLTTDVSTGQFICATVAASGYALYAGDAGFAQISQTAYAPSDACGAGQVLGTGIAGEFVCLDTISVTNNGSSATAGTATFATYAADAGYAQNAANVLVPCARGTFLTSDGGQTWCAQPPAQTVYYFHNESMIYDGVTEESLLQTVSTGTVIEETASVTSGGGEVEIDEYVTGSGDPGVDALPEGVWNFRLWGKVDSLAGGASYLKAYVYRHHDGSTDEPLFSAQSGALSLALTEERFSSAQPAFQFSTADRLVVKIVALTASAASRTVTWAYEGPNGSHLVTPVATSGVAYPLAGALGGLGNALPACAAGEMLRSDGGTTWCAGDATSAATATNAGNVTVACAAGTVLTSDGGTTYCAAAGGGGIWTAATGAIAADNTWRTVGSVYLDPVASSVSGRTCTFELLGQTTSATTALYATLIDTADAGMTSTLGVSSITGTRAVSGTLTFPDGARLYEVRVSTDGGTSTDYGLAQRASVGCQ